jgi:hypothetical protein
MVDDAAAESDEDKGQEGGGGAGSDSSDEEELAMDGGYEKDGFVHDGSDDDSDGSDAVGGYAAVRCPRDPLTRRMRRRSCTVADRALRGAVTMPTALRAPVPCNDRPDPMFAARGSNGDGCGVPVSRMDAASLWFAMVTFMVGLLPPRNVEC